MWGRRAPEGDQRSLLGFNLDFPKKGEHPRKIDFDLGLCFCFIFFWSQGDRLLRKESTGRSIAEKGENREIGSSLGLYFCFVSFFFISRRLALEKGEHRRESSRAPEGEVFVLFCYKGRSTRPNPSPLNWQILCPRLEMSPGQFFSKIIRSKPDLKIEKNFRTELG